VLLLDKAGIHCHQLMHDFVHHKGVTVLFSAE
jgi:hypothetical protein